MAPTEAGIHDNCLPSHLGLVQAEVENALKKQAQAAAAASTEQPALPNTHAVKESFQRKLYPQGAEVFREGQAGRYAYLIERGRVEVSARRRGKRYTIATLGPGDLFGEMALLDRRVRSATATVLDETEVVAISRDQLQRKMKTADPVLDLLVKVILHRFRSTLRHLLESENLAPDVQSETGGLRAVGEATRELAITQIKMAEELRAALERDEFRVFYQPIVRLRDGQTAGLEALIRWQRPAHGLVPPAGFLSLSEDTGLICPIGRWVLERACADLAGFQKRFAAAAPGSPSLFVSVNVSAQQLQDPEQVAALGEVVERSGIDPAQIKLEITEGLLIDNPEAASVALEGLKRLGVKLAIDDFGTGYSSLSYLRRYPIDTVKIDRSFVEAMRKDHGSLQIVRAITQLAQTLGMDVVAEGVERQEDIRHLQEFGCHYAQGYLFSKPAPFRQMLNFLGKRIRN